MVLVLTLALFTMLAILVTYPIAVRPTEFSVLNQYTDDLLQAWTIEWNVHSLLAGPLAIGRIWDANIFYPYPLTLIFTEHLLPTSWLLMPFTLLGSTPLISTNLGVLLTTVLSGWGMYLLVTWLTDNRWAGLVAGLFFAVAPFRMSHITQLNLLSTHWIPFIFLAAARLVRSNRRSDLALLLIFTNLQFWSVINYATIVAIGLAVWIAIWLFVYRKGLSLSLFVRLTLFGLVTLALNWPILNLYQQVSQRMEVVRTLGDAAVFGASIENYLVPIANSLLYGRLLHLPTHLEYLSTRGGSVASAFVGVGVLVLALIGLVIFFRSKTNRRITATVPALLLIIAVGFFLSFGSNSGAFGEVLSPVVAPLLPYPYVYRLLPLFQGLRVLFRFALLPTFGLAILAGIGFAALGGRLAARGKPQWILAVLVGPFILIEHLAAPLPGVLVPYGNELYTWLANRPQGVVLELPYYLHTDQSYRELGRVYQSPEHWQRLVNGNSGFKPEYLVKLGPVLDGFPDWRSFDVARQFGVDYVVLHRNEYPPEAWENLVALLPGYLPSIKSVHTAGDDLVLQLRPADCQAAAALVAADASGFPRMAIHNGNPSTFVADPHQVSAISTGSQERQFLEPLFVLPGQTLAVDLPVDVQPPGPAWRVDLANLGISLSTARPSSRPVSPEHSPVGEWQPVQIPFANKAVLQSMALGDAPATCGVLTLKLEWVFSHDAGEMVQVKLIDRFGRLVTGANSRPKPEAGSLFSTHPLPLAETIPPGLYLLQVRLISADGAEISPLGPDGSPVADPLALPIVIRAGMKQSETDREPPVVAQLSNGVGWLSGEGWPDSVSPGDWVRFTLKWQNVATSPLADYTVFTQLIGPDGKVCGQQDNPPGGGWYPTSLWLPGEIVADDYAVRLDPAAPPGEYRLIAGMYDPATGERATIEAGPGVGTDFVEVAVIVVPGPNPQ